MKSKKSAKGKLSFSPGKILQGGYHISKIPLMRAGVTVQVHGLEQGMDTECPQCHAKRPFMVVLQPSKGGFVCTKCSALYLPVDKSTCQDESLPPGGCAIGGLPCDHDIGSSSCVGCSNWISKRQMSKLRGTRTAR